jgi:hypothetical protein
MQIAAVRACRLREIEPLRKQYREVMKNSQIIHDSIYGRTGWTREYALSFGPDEGWVRIGAMAACVV